MLQSPPYFWYQILNHSYRGYLNVMSPWPSVMYNCYLIKYLNTNNVCGLSIVQCDQHCRTTKQNSTIDAYNLKSYGEKYRLYHFVILGKKKISDCNKIRET